MTVLKKDDEQNANAWSEALSLSDLEPLPRANFWIADDLTTITGHIDSTKVRSWLIDWHVSSSNSFFFLIIIVTVPIKLRLSLRPLLIDRHSSPRMPWWISSANRKCFHNSFYNANTCNSARANLSIHPLNGRLLISRSQQEQSAEEHRSNYFGFFWIFALIFSTKFEHFKKGRASGCLTVKHPAVGRLTGRLTK